MDETRAADVRCGGDETKRAEGQREEREEQEA